MTRLTFPSHAEPMVREGLRLILESIPLGAPGPLMQVEIVPVVMPSAPRFELVVSQNAEADEQPEPACGVSEVDDG